MSRALILVLVAATLSAYQGVWAAGWVVDDGAVLTAPALTSLRPRLPGRTLTYASFAVDRALWGDQPRGWHGTSLLLHTLNGLLVGLLVARLVAPGWPAGLAAATFLLHPIQVASVAYVANRGELLVALCLLLATLILVGGRSRWRWGLVAVLIAGAGLAKQMGVMALPLLALVVWLQPGARPSRRVGILVAAVLLGLALAGGLEGLWVPWLSYFGWASVTAWGTFVADQAVTVWQLLGRLVVPTGFSVVHDWRATALTGPLAVGGLVGLAGWAWRCRHRAPLVAMGLGWFLVALAPRFLFSGAVFATTPATLAEHHLYVPLIGLALAVAWAIPVRLLEGDVVNFAGVYEINPLSHAAKTQRMTP